MKIKTNPVQLASKGYYGIKVFKEDGTEVLEKRVEKVDNVVTFTGAYYLFFESRPTVTMFCAVGTGTVERTRTSTSLDNQTYRSSFFRGAPRSGELDNGDGTSTINFSRTYDLPLGGVVGTISEVGLVASSSDLIAGQLIKDEFGSPTTITILSDEQLVITYELELTFPNGEVAVSPIVGSGSVTTPRGTTAYTLYAQPFYTNYPLNGEDDLTTTRDSRNYYVSKGSNGTTTIGEMQASISKSTSLDSNGVVNVDYQAATASPSDFNSTDIKFILLGNSQYDYYTDVDTTTKLVQAHGSSSDACAPVVLEFDSPVTKLDSESFIIRASAVFQI